MIFFLHKRFDLAEKSLYCVIILPVLRNFFHCRCVHFSPLLNFLNIIAQIGSALLFRVKISLPIFDLSPFVT